MVTLRLTKRLQKYLGVVPAATLEPTTAALGDWYGNVVGNQAGDLFLFVNEKSLLAVAIPVREAVNLLPLFHLRVANLLGMLGVDPRILAEELLHLTPIQFANTASRSVLGSLNDFAYQLQAIAEFSPDRKVLSLSEAELNLSETPCKPLGYRSPDDVAPEILAQAYKIPITVAHPKSGRGRLN